ncbi:DUF4304 domain-containing protein [Stenotrophomonas sp.]|uniref:DUF4304 domain-containing protein n=1 Tax=Stenotrophomonas sp. TaxID=69392 RepID=UPI0028AF7D6C|nr:DUF4304 domain-containing protein [Stenotrophomonas sp.]
MKGYDCVKTPGQLMAISIKKVLLPALRQLGFGGSGVTHFVRASDDHRDFLSIQYWTYGGSFILEFSRVPTDWVDPESGEVPKRVFETDPLLRRRLIDTEQHKDFRGFSFKAFGSEQSRYDQLAASVVALLPQIEAWLEDGIQGPNIH